MTSTRLILFCLLLLLCVLLPSAAATDKAFAAKGVPLSFTLETKEKVVEFFPSQEFATKTLFYLAGYALPLLSDATRDKDPFIREQAVLAYPSYLDALDALGPRPQWALSLNKNHNQDRADWRAFAGARSQ